MEEKKLSLFESILLESDACVSLIANIIFHLRNIKNFVSTTDLLCSKVEEFIKNASKLENFLGSIVMRKECRSHHEDLMNLILDGRNSFQFHTSMTSKHINTLVIQYFDSFTAGEVLRHLLSVIFEVERRECLFNRLEALKRNLRSLLLHEFNHSSSQLLPSSPVQIIRLLPIDELSERSLRWLSSFSPSSVSDTNTSSGQQKQGTRVSNPLGLCFRCNWNAALVCARKFPLSHMHQALTVTSSARGVSSQEVLFHSSRILLWMGLQAAVATTIATSSDAHLTWVKNLHFPIGVSFGKDENQPGADGKVYNVAYVVSQLAPEGSLQDAYFSSADTRISLKPDEKVSILLDVATALRALHSAGLAHGRVKARNVLLFPGSPRYRAKLADFGLQAALTPRERSVFSGDDSARWTAPEILMYEARLEEATAKRVPNRSNTVKMKCYDVAAPLCSSIDVYSFGLLIMALLTEKVPFHNLLLEEGQRAQLVSGVVRPTLPSTYPNKEFLSPLEALLADCTKEEPHSRPAMDEVAQRLEAVYVDIILSEVKGNLTLRQTQLGELQKEDKDYEEKITKQLDLVARAKIILARKESEKAAMYKVQERAAKEAELEKGRSRLKQFENDLEGFQRDKAGLEEDIASLTKLLGELTIKVKKTPADLMAARVWNEQVNQEDLRRKYTTEKERTSPYIQSLSIRALNQLISSASSASILPSDKKRIESEWGALIEQLWDAAIASSDGDSSNQVRFKAYTDNIATLMLHPEVANLTGLESQPPPFTISNNNTPISSGLGLGLGPTPNKIIRNISSSSIVSSLTGNTETLTAAKLLLKDSDDDSDDENHVTRNHNQIFLTTEKENNSSSLGSRSVDIYHSSAPIQSDQVDSDDGAAGGYNGSTARDDAPKEVVFEFDSKFSRAGGKVESGIPEDDLIGVLYLAASAGDLDQALGMYRNSMGYSRAEVKAMIDRQHSPIHLSAYLGNLEALREIYQQYAFEVCAQFTYEGDSHKLLRMKNDLGDTPLHCACRRGHFNAVKALVEEYNSAIYDVNNNGLLPIHLALSAGSLRIAKYFMEDSFFGIQKVKADLLDARYGASLLHWASLNDRPEVVDYLLNRYKMSVEIVAQSDNSTCLLWACFGSSIEMVKHLIERCNANVLATTNTGLSCLHMAVLSGVVDKAAYLIDKVGLKVNAKDGMGRTSFDIAQGQCLLYLIDRNNKGFLTGSLMDKAAKSKK